MTWLLPSLVHALVCLIALTDLVSADMAARARWCWLAAVALLPLAGAAAYAVWRARG